MQELEFLKDLVIVLGAGLVVVTLLDRVRIPPIAGYILAGVLVGPGVLSLIRDAHRIEVLAEVGVVLLLFGIGLELSPERIRRLWRAVLVGGSLQVGATIAAVMILAYAFDLPPSQGAFIGFVVAVSSTAIVLRALSARGEIDAPHGRLAVGILIFQDLSVVPMMLAVPLLAGTRGMTRSDLLETGAGILLLGLALLVVRQFSPVLLRMASRTKQRDVFLLAVAVICFGVAWLASYTGVSVALGAFLAGLMVSGSEFRDQALSDVIPLREVLASVFFVSIGMLLDTTDVLSRIGPTILLLLAILAVKFVILMLTATVMRLPLRVSILTAAALCQVGEFSFVLLRSGRGAGLIPAPLEDTLLVAVILSMLFTPFLLQLGPRLAAGVGRITPLTRLLDVDSIEEDDREKSLTDHVILAGYGLAGQELAQTLAGCGIPYLVLDLNVENVRRAKKDGVPAYFGDVTSSQVLEHLGIERARELVLVVNDPDAAMRAVRMARRLVPGLRIIVRTAYLQDSARLLAAGANQVVTADLESAVELVRLSLEGYGVDEPTTAEQLARIRSRRASMA